MLTSTSWVSTTTIWKEAARLWRRSCVWPALRLGCWRVAATVVVHHAHAILWHYCHMLRRLHWTQLLWACAWELRGSRKKKGFVRMTKNSATTFKARLQPRQFHLHSRFHMRSKIGSATRKDFQRRWYPPTDQYPNMSSTIPIAAFFARTPWSPVFDMRKCLCSDSLFLFLFAGGVTSSALLEQKERGRAGVWTTQGRCREDSYGSGYEWFFRYFVFDNVCWCFQFDSEKSFIDDFGWMIFPDDCFGWFCLTDKNISSDLATNKILTLGRSWRNKLPSHMVRGSETNTMN